MRISTNQIYRSGLGYMQDMQSSLSKIQEQVSSGVKLARPSDDPIAFSRSMKISEEIAINKQFSQNIRAATGRNQLSESMMGSAVDVLQRMRELAVLASTDTLNAGDREGISYEIRTLQEELAGIMNATDGNGEHLFSGFQGGVKPFEPRNGGGYDYMGDEGQRLSQITPSTSVKISDSGKNLFVDIAAAQNSIVTRADINNDPEGNAVISVGQIYDQSALDEVFPEKFIITFGDPAEHQNRQTYTVRRASDLTPVVGTHPVGSLENVTYVPGESINFHGVRVSVGGNPQPGDTFFVESTGNQSVMNTVERFALMLEQYSGEADPFDDTAPLVGRAAPPRPTLTAAGNYVADQTLTLSGANGSVQTLSVARNQDIASVASALDALNNITANFEPAVATMDFGTTAAYDGDLIEFEVNGVVVQTQAGATATATYNNIDAALGALLPVGGLSYVNNGSGRFEFTEANGNDIAVSNFQVQQFPGTEIDIVSGLAPGETLEFTLTGSAGEVVNVNYVAGSASVDELAGQMQSAITAAGFGSSMAVTQAGPGQPAVLRYLNGGGQVQLSNMTDNAADNVVLSVNSRAGSVATDAITNGAVSEFRANNSVNVTVQPQVGTVGLTGAVGDTVTLRHGDNDSSSVAARLVYQAAEGFELTSNINSQNGGLVHTPPASDAVSVQLREGLNASISNLDNALNNVSRARSEMGARLSMLENTQESNEGLNVDLQGFLSKLKDVDYAEALTEVQLKTFIMQAAQNTFVKTSNLSLFNFL